MSVKPKVVKSLPGLFHLSERVAWIGDVSSVLSHAGSTRRFTRKEFQLIRQENTSINAQESELRYSDIFVLILVALFQKQPKAAFSKIKTTHRVALFLSTFSRLAAACSLKKLASIKASVSFPFFQTSVL